MKNLSSKITQVEFEKIERDYSKYKVGEVKSTSIRALYKTKFLTITVYKNDTLLLQGDEKAIYAFNMKMKEEVLDETNKVVSSTKFENVDGVIGMDEVGTGDYFGPIVTCACYLPNQNINKVKELGVDDSKKLNDKNIVKLAKELSKYAYPLWKICNNKSYNKLIDLYENNNIVKTIYHNDTLHQLKTKLKSTKTYKVVLDQFVSRENYYKYLIKADATPENINIIEVKAEGKYLAVACASVVARAVFLSEMSNLEKKCGLKLPKGSARIDDIVEVGKQLIKKHKLDDFAKLHFASITKKING